MVVKNRFYSFSLIDESNCTFNIKDMVNGKVYANGAYQYILRIRPETVPSIWHGFRGDEPVVPSVSVSKLEGVRWQLKSKDKVLRILEGQGVLKFKETVKDVFHVRHEFIFPKDCDYFEEIIHIQKEGAGNYEFDLLNFGFCFKLRDGAWGKEMDTLRVVGVPFRRKATGELNDFSMWEFLNQARFGEGWILTDKKSGLLVNKYSQDMIETSAIGLSNNEDKALLRFGGVYFNGWQAARYDRLRQKRSDHTLELEHRLNANQKVSFGLTRYTFFKGNWDAGYKKYRSFLVSQGHILPENYHTEIFMNAYYNLAMVKYDLKQIESFVRKGKKLGAEFLYLDPQWNVELSSEIWSKEKLGPVEEFVKYIEKKYQMGVGVHIMGSYHPSIKVVCMTEHGGDPTAVKQASETEVIEYNRGLYPEGSLRINAYGKECWDFCYASSFWKKEKVKRMLTLAKAGMKYFPFDFFPWEGACYAPNHGHPVPSSIEDHCRALIDVIQEVHRKYPDIIIELHDPIAGGVPDRPTPFYYMHGLPYSYDEVWAFEFMDSPLVFLLNGQAVSLYYYNLAYEIPLCLHFNMEQDNENCLGFWWYASTVRHIGVGGFNNPEQLNRYCEAIKLYKQFREFFTHGRFFGVDEMTHLHVFNNNMIVMVFNLTNKEIKRKIKINLSEVGLKIRSVQSVSQGKWRVKGKVLNIECTLGPMQSRLIEVRTGYNEP